MMGQSSGTLIYSIVLNNDDLDKELKETNNKLEQNGSKAVAIGNMLSSAIMSTANAFLDLGKQAVESIASYEQLSGGVEAMFKNSEDGASKVAKVMETASKSWKDLTMSQNDYFNTFNSTYPLIKSSIEDENEAIDTTNRMLSLESDLANTFGYDMESSANAINWALKGTYSYLDNLNIGIKGTKEGFQEVAEQMGYNKDVSELTGNEILDILERTADQYGVLGKTGQEATTTIEGSMKMLKASFDNFLNGSGSVEELVSAIGTFADNLIPAIIEMTPRLIQGVIELVHNLVIQLPDIINMIVDILPELIQIIANELPTLIPDIIEAIMEIIPMLIDNLPLFIKAGYDLIIALYQGILNSMPSLYEGLWNVIKSIINFWKQMPSMMIDIGKNVVSGIWQGIRNYQDWLLNKIKSFAKTITNGIRSFLGIHSASRLMRDQIGQWLPKGIAVGIDENTDSVMNSLKDMNEEIMTEMNKAVLITAGEMNANASVNSNFANNKVILLNAQFSGNVELDGQKAGRILTPVISQTIKNGGGV